MKQMTGSLSARRAWIEIVRDITGTSEGHVALRKESVDRNARSCARFSRCLNVALRKESVDRNSPGTNTILSTTASLSARRAWIEISVTRYRPTPKPSLSARRAWIEI